MGATIHDQPEPIGTLNPEVPPPLSWVVERCLAKEPDKRYFSTLDLARDLLAIRDRVSDLQPNRTEARASNLPTPGSAFVGRDKEKTAAKALLLRDRKCGWSPRPDLAESASRAWLSKWRAR